MHLQVIQKKKAVRYPYNQQEKTLKSQPRKAIKHQCRWL